MHIEIPTYAGMIAFVKGGEYIMKLTMNDKSLQKFVTIVGLTTSNGPHGYDIMANEWAHMISHSPALLLVAIKKVKATYENIIASREFGVSLASYSQNVLSSVAGNVSGRTVDKFAVLKDLGHRFYKAQDIDVMMVEGASMNAECKLVKVVDIGDHPLLIGEIVRISHTDEESLLYHKGMFWKRGEKVQKPSEEALSEIKELIEKHEK